MTLYWPTDPNLIDLTGPRLHALIIGVGDYPHLLQGAPNAFKTNFGLQQLTTTVHTAKRIAKWLATEYKNDDVPLGSIELFLSPAQEIERPDGSKVKIDDATMANVKAVFRPEWLHKRCMVQPGGITWFYFAGHGLTEGTGHYLLLSDFSDPAQNKWDNCVDFTMTRKGMGKVDATQLFFVDACRETPIEILTQANPPTGVRLADDAQMFEHPDSEGTYYAAAEGRLAYGPDDDITYFATALIESLEGAAARNNKKGAFTVDTYSLSDAIGRIVNKLAEKLSRALIPAPHATGGVASIHMAKAPHACTTITFVSDQAEKESAIKLQLGGAAPIQSAAGEARPWFGRLTPGKWAVEVTFANYPLYQALEEVTQPVYEVEVPV